jgi:hypothetical protein
LSLLEPILLCVLTALILLGFGLLADLLSQLNRRRLG